MDFYSDGKTYVTWSCTPEEVRQLLFITEKEG